MYKIWKHPNNNDINDFYFISTERDRGLGFWTGPDYSCCICNHSYPRYFWEQLERDKHIYCEDHIPLNILEEFKRIKTICKMQK